MPFATARKEVTARFLERLRGIGPHLVDTAGQQAQKRSVQPLESAGSVIRGVLESYAGQTRHEHRGRPTHDIRLLQGKHHFLRSESERSAQNPEKPGRAGPERQRVAVRDELSPFPEPGGDQVSEIASAPAKRKDSKVVILERPVLYKRQEPVLGAASIESIHHVENAHAILAIEPI
jgi:hypothetical protein